MADRCERCGEADPAPDKKGGLLDYCAACLAFRCDACMAEGCCGDKPAHSGWRAHEYGDPTVEIEALHKRKPWGRLW